MFLFVDLFVFVYNYLFLCLCEYVYSAHVSSDHRRHSDAQNEQKLELIEKGKCDSMLTHTHILDLARKRLTLSDVYLAHPRVNVWLTRTAPGTAKIAFALTISI